MGEGSGYGQKRPIFAKNIRIQIYEFKIGFDCFVWSHIVAISDRMSKKSKKLNHESSSALMSNSTAIAGVTSGFKSMSLRLVLTVLYGHILLL